MPILNVNVESIFETTIYREIYLPLSFIIVVLGIQIVFILFYNFFKFKRMSKVSSRIFLAFGFLFAGYTIGFFSLTIQRFYTTIEISKAVSKILYMQTWFFFGIGVVTTTIILENTFQDTYKTRYLYTIIAFCSLIFNIIISKYPFFAYSGLILFSITNIYYFMFLYFLFRRGTKEIKKNLLKMIIGFSLFTFNFLFANIELLKLIKSEFFLIMCYVFQIVGGLFLFDAFINIPSFSDADWRKTIEELYIISKKNNNTIYYYNFSHPMKKAHHLYAGGIIGIESMISSIGVDDGASTKIQSIDKDDFSIILKHKKSFIAILVVKYKYKIHREVLSEIVSKFNDSYGFLIENSQIDKNNTVFDGFFQYIQNKIE